MSSSPTVAPVLALVVTLLVQVSASFSLAVPSVLAPAVAHEFGAEAQHVGWLVSIAYFAAMLGGLLCGGLSRRYGSVRMSQAAMLAMGLALALCAYTNPLALLVAGLLLGVGYGIPNPTAAEILSRHSPRDRRGLFFSIKQTGVPLGVAITGVILPALVTILDWQSAVLLMATLLVAGALAIGRTRRTLDGDGPAQATARLDTERADSAPGVLFVLVNNVWWPLLEVLTQPALRRLALASLAYACAQVAYLSFLVSLLKIEHGMSLALAAGLLSASQLVSVIARVGWGYVSDKWVDPGRLLGILGVGMAASLLLLAGAPADTPWQGILGITVLCAATTVAWNGVFYADLVRHVAPGEVTRTTGATQFMTFLGGMGGAAGFAALVSAADSYSAAFSVMAVLPAISGIVLLWNARARLRQG
jgi:MFS family permease